MFHTNAQSFHRIGVSWWNERYEALHRNAGNIHNMGYVQVEGTNIYIIAASEWSEHNETIHIYTENVHIMGHVSREVAWFP
jgi:hypothetical protein